MEKEYGITDDYMFCTVMSENKDLCKELIERILDIKVRDINYLNSQEAIKLSPDGKGIRLDVYVEDDANTVFDLEMQTSVNNELPKRSRYYQSMIDQSVLESGEDYDKLRKSYIIFICTKDPFKSKLCKYSFVKICEQNPELILRDEANLVFLNAEGKDENLSKDLKNLLEYFRTGKPTDEYTATVQEKVDVKSKDSSWRKERMTFEMKLNEIRRETREEDLTVMFSLMNGQITIEEAAKRLGMSVEEFKSKMEQKNN